MDCVIVMVADRTALLRRLRGVNLRIVTDGIFYTAVMGSMAGVAGEAIVCPGRKNL